MKAADEAAIRHQIDSWVVAFRTKDINLSMSLYDQEIVSFDIVPPLQYVGRDSYREIWEATFEMFKDPIDVEIRDPRITVGDGVAFSYKFLRLRGTRTNGQQIDYSQRLTFGFRKVDGKWLIAHEHVSVPTDFQSGNAILDLKP